MLFGMCFVSLPAIGVAVPMQHTPGASLCLVVGSALPHLPLWVSTKPTDGSRALQIKGLQGNEPYPFFNQLYLEIEELATRLERAAFPIRLDKVRGDKEIETV